MARRAHRQAIAEETLAVLASGHYRAQSGSIIDISALIGNATQRTTVYRPADLDRPVTWASESQRPPVIEVVNQSSLSGARDLLAEGTDQICVLNFASAKRPGGGFLGGADAQEEALTRATALYACLQRAEIYYRANRACATALYTHHIIYAPDVPVIRGRHDELLDEPWLCSFISAPAPNAGAVRANEPRRQNEIIPTLQERARRVLEVCRLNGERVLVLGAWGCNVFTNEPHQVAAIFRDHLASASFAGAFDRVRFSVCDHPDGTNIRAFTEVLKGG